MNRFKKFYLPVYLYAGLIFLLSSFPLIIPEPCFSEIIYFKNGGKVEGIISEETDDEVVLDVGFGTMTLNKDEIDYIEKSSPEELEQLKKKKLVHEIEQGDWAPARFDDIKELYRRALDNKAELREARGENNSLKVKISAADARISELADLLDEKGRELKGMDPEKDVKAYNETVVEINSTNVSLKKESDRLKALYEEKKKSEMGLSGLAAGYHTSYQQFISALNDKNEQIDESRLADKELYFVKIMDKAAVRMENDFKKDVAPFISEGGHIIVNALLNEKVSARLMVDTGASIVIISTEVAYSLGINYDTLPSYIEVITADGRSVEARPVTLKSVKVGNAEVENVQAAILDSDAVGGVDGLLGMSFLNNFIMKVDSTSNKLILEKVL